MATRTATPTKTQQIEELLIDLLADELDETPHELRARLQAGGGTMPIDSLQLLEIVPALRKETKLSLLTSKLTRQATKSVAAFAHYIAHEAK
jgi:acyl carrier protein